MITPILYGLAVAILAANGEPFVEASHCGTLGCDWVIAVSHDGLVTVDTPLGAHRSTRYRLSSKEFGSFKLAVERERPTELSGRIGDLAVDGPVREVRVNVGGHSGTFRLYTTPPGIGWTYRTDSGDVSRAIRVCEAVRALGGGKLASCVDVR